MGYPDHPDEIVISKKEHILGGPEIDELEVWSYYEGIKNDLIPILKGHDLFIVIKTDSKIIYKRRPYDKKTEFIRIANKKDFEEYNSGRTVEYHVTMPVNTDLYIVDFDVVSDFDRAKNTTKEIYEMVRKMDGVESVKIHYTGKRGFHILGKLKKPKNVDEARKNLDKELKKTFGNRNDLVVQESPKDGKSSLGISPMKENGGHVALWSMRVSGLCCVEVPLTDLDKFKKSDATPDKVHKKLTGKKLKRIEKKSFNLARKVASNFLSQYKGLNI